MQLCRPDRRGSYATWSSAAATRSQQPPERARHGDGSSTGATGTTVDPDPETLNSSSARSRVAHGLLGSQVPVSRATVPDAVYYVNGGSTTPSYSADGHAMTDAVPGVTLSCSESPVTSTDCQPVTITSQGSGTEYRAAAIHRSRAGSS